MKYKVIKNFLGLEKGDILTSNNDTVSLTACEEKAAGYIKRSIEFNKELAEVYVKNGFLLEIHEPSFNSDNTKLKQINEYIDSLLDTYGEDYNNMLEAFENGDVQPCVKVEAETVYHNLIKVLKSIKGKINE